MIFSVGAKSGPDSVKDLQSLVNIMVGSSRLEVDGLLGPATSKAVASLTVDQSKLVKQLVAARPNLSAGSAPAAVSAGQSTLRAMITAQAVKLGLNPEIALTVVSAESKFVPNARSKTGASGLFQLTGSAIEDVARRYGRSYFRSTSEDRNEISWNIEVGVRYLIICAGYASVSPKTTSVEDWAKIYACYNIGVGSYKKLQAKRFQDPELIVAVGQQASALQKGGAASYLANAFSYISSNVQRA